MTSRRALLRLAGTLPAAALVAACQPGRQPTPAGGATGQGEGGELLLVELAAGLAVLDTATAALLRPPAPGAAAWDGSAMVTSSATGIEVIGSTGKLDYRVDPIAGLTARVVSPYGYHVGLASGAASGASPYRPEGRAETTVAVVDSAGKRAEYTLPGCVEPEAFSPDGQIMYVLDYLPPREPEAYRVRMLDLATGEYGALYTRDKKIIPPGAEEEMRGEGRQAVYGRHNQSLYTLYTHQPDHEHTRELLAHGARDDAPGVHAFVHTLTLPAQFAFCIDLPAPFGEASAQSHAIAIAPGSEAPFVVDAATGTVAAINPTDLTVARRAAAFPGTSATDETAAAVSLDGATLFVANGRTVHRVRTGDLTSLGAWSLDEPARGIVAGRRSTWIGQPDSLVAVDPSTGAVVDRVAVPGLGSLRQAVNR